MIETNIPHIKFNGVRRALQTNSGPAPAIQGLYFHVPFCFHKCHYCDFYSIVDSPNGNSGGENPQSPPAREDAFVDRMIQELNWYAEQVDLRPSTIFVGGGTPTLLSPAAWNRIFEVFQQLRLLENVSEFTIEANPETVTADLLATLVAGGVNRVSIGAQSFDETLLKKLERWHDPASVGKAIDLIRAAGIDNISLDLIFAIPGQSLEQLDADLDRAFALNPKHVSAYALIYEPNTAMTERLRQGQFESMDEDAECEMFERVIKRMNDAEFEHYEVSNWAIRSDTGTNETSASNDSIESCASNGPSPYRSAHNLLYWHNANWLGIGPAAASHLSGHRWKNAPHLGQYLASKDEPPIVDHEQLDQNASVGEQLMMSLRVRDGVRLDWIDAHIATGSPRDAALQSLTDNGMLERTASHLRLTDRGLMVADAVIGELL